jgi:hypothetical protein
LSSECFENPLLTSVTLKQHITETSYHFTMTPHGLSTRQGWPAASILPPSSLAKDMCCIGTPSHTTSDCTVSAMPPSGYSEHEQSKYQSTTYPRSSLRVSMPVICRQFPENGFRHAPEVRASALRRYRQDKTILRTSCDGFSGRAGSASIAAPTPSKKSRGRKDRPLDAKPNSPRPCCRESLRYQA